MILQMDLDREMVRNLHIILKTKDHDAEIKAVG